MWESGTGSLNTQATTVLREAWRGPKRWGLEFSWGIVGLFGLMVCMSGETLRSKPVIVGLADPSLITAVALSSLPTDGSEGRSVFS